MTKIEAIRNYLRILTHDLGEVVSTLEPSEQAFIDLQALYLNMSVLCDGWEDDLFLEEIIEGRVWI